jgi:hypothetical protein
MTLASEETQLVKLEPEEEEEIIWNFDNVQKAYATRGYEAKEKLEPENQSPKYYELVSRCDIVSLGFISKKILIVT